MKCKEMTGCDRVRKRQRKGLLRCSTVGRTISEEIHHLGDLTILKPGPRAAYSVFQNGGGHCNQSGTNARSLKKGQDVSARSRPHSKPGRPFLVANDEEAVFGGVK